MNRGSNHKSWFGSVWLTQFGKPSPSWTELDRAGLWQHYLWLENQTSHLLKGAVSGPLGSPPGSRDRGPGDASRNTDPVLLLPAELQPPPMHPVS